MKTAFHIALKDTKLFFLSSSGALILSISLLLAEYFFINFLANFNLALQRAAGQSYLGIEKITLTTWVVENYFLTLIIFNLFLIPLLVMRGIPEERRAQTWNLLLNYPLSNFSIIIGKYLGALCPLLVFQFLATSIAFCLFIFDSLNFLALIVGIGGVLLSTATMLAVAVAVSYFSSPILASLLSFFVLVSTFCLSLISGRVSVDLAELFSTFSPLEQVKSLIRAEISLTSFSFHLLLITFALYLLCRFLKIERQHR